MSRLLAGLAIVSVLGGLAALRPGLPMFAAEASQLDLRAEAPTHDSRIVIEGRVEGAGTATLVLRVDDGRSRDYASRVNVERVFPPGRIRWETPLGGLVAIDGRPIELSSLRTVMVFNTAGPAAARIDAIRLARPRPLPAGAKGYAFGAADAPLPEGFERVSPGDLRLEGGAAEVVRRPMPDPLAANGLKGLGRVRLAWPAERARVTLWAEDPGEWELLAHPLRRRILVNGRVALDESFTPAEWVRYRYLRNRDEEHGESSDAWTAFGRARTRPRTIEVEGLEGAIDIRLEGAAPGDRFLNAVLVAPTGVTKAADRVMADRARWYRDGYPVLKREVGGEAADVLGVDVIDGRVVANRPLSVRLAAGSAARLRIRLGGLASGVAAEVRLEVADTLRDRIDARIWMARQRLERRRAQDSYLTLADNMLIATHQVDAAPEAGGRLLEAWLSADRYVPAGRHMAHLVVQISGVRSSLPVALEIIDVRLPEAQKPVGVYLDESPHTMWFDEFATQRSRQIECDLTFVTRLGLAGSAPALSTPSADHEPFIADMRRAAVAGLASPLLAYAPAKRVLAALGIQEGAAQIADVSRALVARGVTPPLWSIADEPSNPGNAAVAATWLKALRDARVPGLRVAGHLNARRDREMISSFDVALVNSGFGLDAGTIAEAARTGTEIWLYNTEAPRLAGGLWLWRTAARRYVQWHARMPTADPFDPLDGREGDEQLLLPTAEVCPATPSIHRDLLELAEGVVDQRWLLWLDGRTEQDALALKRQISANLGEEWGRASRLTRPDLQKIRESIMDLAMGLASTP